MATTDYGEDVSTFPFEGTGRTVKGQEALKEWALRVLTTDAGSLPYAPNDGFNVRVYLNEDMGPGEVYELESGAGAALQRDERIAAARVVATFPTELSMRLTITLEPVEGEAFTFTATVDPLTAAILAEAA